MVGFVFFSFFFFFNDTATTEIYTLSLHDALPLHILALAGRAAGVGEHGHDRVDVEHGGGFRRADGDFGQLLAARIGIDRAVAVDQHPRLHAHEEDAGHHQDIGTG